MAHILRNYCNTYTKPEDYSAEKKLSGLACKNHATTYNYEERGSGGLWVNFGHLKFFNVHPMHGTVHWLFLDYAPIEM